MELVKSIQSTLYERAVSPLAGVFILSWSLMHYDLVMMLFSKNIMFYKTQIVYEVMYIDAQYNWGEWPAIWMAPYWYGFIKPLIFSFIALIAYSLASWPAFYVSSRAKNELQLIKLSFDKDRPISAEKFLAIEKKFNDEKKIFREAAIEYEASVESYKHTYQVEKNKNLDLSRDVEELKDKNLSLLKELDGFKKKGLIQGEIELNDMAKFGKFENEIHAMEDKAGRVSLEGSYYSLFFEAHESILYRSLLKNIPRAEAESDIKMLESLGKPKTQSNIDRISKALVEFGLYHIVETETPFGYELTGVGIMLHDAYELGINELEKACIELDRN